MSTPDTLPQAAAVAPGSASRWTDDQIRWLMRETDLWSSVAQADNKKLLWLAMQTQTWKALPLEGPDAAIFTEIENRLFPEYDGDTVTCEEWGWKTPESEIRYLPITP